MEDRDAGQAKGITFCLVSESNWYKEIKQNPEYELKEVPVNDFSNLEGMKYLLFLIGISF